MKIYRKYIKGIKTDLPELNTRSQLISNTCSNVSLVGWSDVLVAWLDSETCHLQTTKSTKSWKWAITSWKMNAYMVVFFRQKARCFGRESLASSLTNGRLDLPG